MFGTQVQRITPRLPAAAMQTHAISAPLETHWRKATCEEVGCLDYHYGWKVALTGRDEEDTTLVRNCGRRYREEQSDAGPVLVFEAGQPCFRQSEHRTRIDRPGLYIVRNGDWRTPARDWLGTARKFSGADAWKDSLQTHLESIEKRR